jgi:hypothetical protein
MTLLKYIVIVTIIFIATFALLCILISQRLINKMDKIGLTETQLSILENLTGYNQFEITCWLDMRMDDGFSLDDAIDDFVECKVEKEEW